MAHWQLALSYAQYLSPELHAIVNDVFKIRAFSSSHHKRRYRMKNPYSGGIYTMNLKCFSLILILVSAEVCADNSALEAAIGGALGGAAGAALGNEIGGRNGAIVGGAVGASVGTAIATDPDHRHNAPARGQYNYYPSDTYPAYPGNAYPVRPADAHGYHCPPGQAKKGRC